MLSDVRFQVGPPIPGSPWTRPRRSSLLGSGTPAPADRVVPAFLFDENANTPERMRVALQQIASMLNDFIRAGTLTVDFLGSNPRLHLGAAHVEEALGGTPVLDTFIIKAGAGLTGGGPLSAQQGCITISMPGVTAPGTVTDVADITLDGFGRIRAVSPPVIPDGNLNREVHID